MPQTKFEYIMPIKLDEDHCTTISFSCELVHKWDDLRTNLDERISIFQQAFGTIPFYEGSEAAIAKVVCNETQDLFENQNQLALLEAREQRTKNLIGIVIISLHKYPENLYIRQAAVHPDFVKKGICSALLKKFNEHYGLRHQETLVITRYQNQSALAAYERMGYVSDDEVFTRHPALTAYNSEQYAGFRKDNYKKAKPEDEKILADFFDCRRRFIKNRDQSLGHTSDDPITHQTKGIRLRKLIDTRLIPG